MGMRCIVFLVVLGLVCSNVGAQTLMSEEELELRQLFFQKNRQGQDYWKQKQYERGVEVFEELYNTPGMANIHGVWAEIVYDLACGYALLGQKDKAISYLRIAADTGLLGCEWLQKDPDLESIRETPEFKEIAASVEKASDRRRSFWDSSALNTPYRENISADEKVAGLSKLWAEVKYNFAYFDRVPEVDWDALYMEYLPKVRKTKSTLEYYRLLRKLAAKLKDGHTSVRFPKELALVAYARPAVWTELVEGKVLVTGVYNDDLRQISIYPGLEVVRIDGVSVHDYARKRVQPYQCASSKQGLDLWTYSLHLLSGSKEEPVELTLRDSRGNVFTRKLPRTGARKDPEPFEFKLLRGNIAHVVLNSFGQERVMEAFDAAYPQIEQADALILDVRKNGGGSSHRGWHILGYLTDKPFKVHASRTRRHISYHRATGVPDEWERLGFGCERRPNGEKLYTKPVVVLTSAYTGSAAEDFCLAFDVMGRGEIIGEPTAGSTGQLLMFGLPGGGGAYVCTCYTTYPDGKEFVGIGIQPDVLVHPTIKDVRAGRDTVLRAALDKLREALAETRCAE